MENIVYICCKNKIKMNVAVILAGGKGQRLGGTLPKQFLKVAGRKIIEHTVEVFERSECIDEILVVCNPAYMNDMEHIVLANQWVKVRKILQGGDERYQSSLAAIRAYDDDSVNLLFHDAVRPLVTDRIIADCVKALQTYEAVDVAIPSTDTIIEAAPEGIIRAIPDRSKLRNGQTPQCFRRGVIRRAYERALQDPDFKTTDDCGVVLRYLPEVPIYIVRGENFNMKVTYAEDLFLVDKLFQLKTIRAGEGSWQARAEQTVPNKVAVVFGGSYGIGAEVVKRLQQLGVVVYSCSLSQYGVDVTDPVQVRRVLASAYSLNRRIDYVVCTAGLLVKEGLFSMSYDDIRRSCDVNFMGAVNVCKEAFTYLKETHGSLLLYTSSSYTRGRMMYSIYSAMKAAIVNLVQALSEEWALWGIRINAVNPERTKTPMRQKNFGIEPDSTLLSAERVAQASVNTLVSGLTGEVIDVRR